MQTADEILAAQDAIMAAAQGRDLTDDEVTSYEALETELAGAEKRGQVLARHAAARQVVTRPVRTAVAPDRDDTLDRAFNAYLRTGVPNADLTELRAQAEGTGSTGGFLVPDTFRTKLVDRMKAYGGLAQVVDEFTTGDGAPVNWPTLDDTANVGEVVAEGGTFTAGADLVFGEANLGAYRYTAGGSGNTPLRVSVELLQDSAFDIEGLITRKLGERIARIQAVHLVRGTGVGQPLGIVTGLTGIQAAANNALTYSDLITYMHSIDPAYQPGARWAFNDLTLSVIQKLIDADGRPLLQSNANGSIANDPGGYTLLGKPVTIDQAFADRVAGSPTVNWGVYGDLTEGYVVRRVRDVQIIVDPYGRAANGQVQFTAWARMDATQQNTNAYVALTGKT